MIGSRDAFSADRRESRVEGQGAADHDVIGSGFLSGSLSIGKTLPKIELANITKMLMLR
jgi:hypothetical protein